MIFDPHKPAAEMTAVELMAAHVAMRAPDQTGEGIVRTVQDIYEALNRRMKSDEQVQGSLH